jgi:hypothetical protein
LPRSDWGAAISASAPVGLSGSHADPFHRQTDRASVEYDVTSRVPSPLISTTPEPMLRGSSAISASSFYRGAEYVSTYWPAIAGLLGMREHYFAQFEARSRNPELK